MDKNDIRRQVKRLKTELSEEFVSEYSALICELIRNQDCYRDASAVYGYMAYNTEISLKKLMDFCHEDGKVFAVPKVLGSGTMEFFEIQSEKDAAWGYMGIPEPDGNTEIRRDRSLLMVMPGLAFGLDHSRIGYGGGYYDRYIEKARAEGRELYLLAPAYEFQIFPSLPGEEHDIKIDRGISLKRIF